MTISNQSASSRTSSLLPPLPSLVAGRDNSFAATLRVICDFAVTDVHTNLSGDASGNRFSPYYKSGMKDWLEGRYQIIKP